MAARLPFAGCIKVERVQIPNTTTPLGSAREALGTQTPRPKAIITGGSLQHI